MLESIKNAVWGMPTVLLLLVLGVYFSIKIKFWRFAVVKSIFSLPFTPKKSNGSGISSFAAAATALGGTVGIGSIFGVGIAIAVGGAGSIFWMWVCSFFGIGLKYAEIKIAFGKKGKGRLSGGGAHRRLCELGYKRLSTLFCIAALLASFTTGNITQIGVASELIAAHGISRGFVGAGCFISVALAVFGGRRAIAGINSRLVPAACILYIGATATVLALNFRDIPKAISEILSSAFGLDSMLGGFSGALLSRALREGFARSMFSNEAGMGSSPLAHATADTENSETQARWGIFEIFFDTFVVSTLTALCLLTSGKRDISEVFGKSFGNIGEIGCLILTAVFALASVISWCYYGECCIAYAFPNGRAAFYIYRALFALCAFFGVYISGESAFALADICNALMTLPNLFLLILCRNEIERIE